MAVRLLPRGGRDAVEGWDEDGSLRVRVAAAPVDGAANESLTRLLAHELDVPRGDVVIEGGLTARRKRVRITGLTEAAVRSRWPRLG